MTSYAEKIVVVTGASSGIGAAFAVEVARRGAHVVLAARRADKLAEVAAACGPTAHYVVTDVTVRADVERLAAETLARHGRVDVWVNNAGRGITRPLLALTDEDVDGVITDNVKSALYGMQAVVPHFLSRGEGVLANVSSMLGRVPFAPIRSVYSASKAALNSLTETARMEYGEKYPNVRFVTVLPGVVATDFGLNARNGGPDSRSFPNAQPVEDVARIMADGLLVRRGDLYTIEGGAARAAGYLTALGA